MPAPIVSTTFAVLKNTESESRENKLLVILVQHLLLRIPKKYQSFKRAPVRQSGI